MKSLSNTIPIIFCLIFLTGSVFSQNPDASKFIEVVYIKSKNADYIKFEKTVWKYYHQSIIQAGKQSAWYVYKLKYPAGDQKEYDYVVVNVYRNWEELVSDHLISDAALKKAIPANDDTFRSRADQSRAIVWRQLFELMGQAVPKEKVPSKYIIANEMKVVPGMEKSYVSNELTYFKPFHTARAEEGIMNNWGLYKRSMPYGEKYPYDYITFNGYATWQDITKQNPPTAWKKVHGDLNFGEIHDKTVSMRQTVNVECWELVDYVVE